MATNIKSSSSSPSPGPVAPPLSTPPKCLVKVQPDGGLQVSFLIEPFEAERLRKRAYMVPLDKFLWENILKQAISSAVF